MVKRVLKPGTTPWLATDAILFLEDFFKERPNAKVLEFGSGGSSVWFAKRTGNLVSIDHYKPWAEQVRVLLGDLVVDFRLVPRPYAFVCDEFEDETIDLVLVDGRDRVECVKKARRIIKPNGVLMLDNSERHRYNPVRIMLKEWPHVEVNQIGPNLHGMRSRKGWRTSWWFKPKE